MTPTERSMPAVRITSVCADAEDADDRHLGQHGRQVAARWRSASGLTATPSRRPSSQHDEGNGGRVDVQEALHALQKGEMLFLEGGDGRRRRGQDLLELLRRRPARWRRFAHGFLARFPTF